MHYKVCTVDELEAGLGVSALIDTTQVAIFCVSKHPFIAYALSNYDPFSEANVISRGIIGELKGKRVVASPIYKEHFCLESGVCLEDDSVRLQTYKVQLEGHTVCVEIA